MKSSVLVSQLPQSSKKSERILFFVPLYLQHCLLRSKSLIYRHLVFFDWAWHSSGYYLMVYHFQRIMCHFQRTRIYPRKAETHHHHWNELGFSSLGWLNTLGIRLGLTWTGRQGGHGLPDSFLSSRMPLSSFTSLFGVKIPQSPRKSQRLQHSNPGIRRTWDSDCFLSARLPWSSFFLCLRWRFHKVHGSPSIQITEMVKSIEDVYILLHKTNCDIGVDFLLCFLYWSSSLVVFS